MWSTRRLISGKTTSSRVAVTVSRRGAEPMESGAMDSSIFFQGSIPEAIAEAQSNKKILVVFISGQDEESSQLEQVTWQDLKVIEEIRQGCVALRLMVGSADASNFSAIFPTSHVPSISVIGFTGALLQQHEGYIAPEEFLAGLQQILATFTPQVQNVAAAGAIATILTTAINSVSAAVTETSAATPNLASSPESAVEQVPDRSSVVRRDPNSTVFESTPPLQRGREDTTASVSEIENVGQGDLASNNEALEATRAIHAQRWSKSKEVKKKGKCIGSESASETPKQVVEKTGPFLLQIRLTNNENIRGEFEATSTLRDVKSFVDEKRTDGSKSYSFVVPFPRKVFTVDDLDKSLKELDLGPRSTVMLVPSRMTSEGSSWSCTTASASVDEVNPVVGGGSLIGRVLSYLNPFSYIRWGGSNPRETTNDGDWDDDSNTLAERERTDSRYLPSRDVNATGFGNASNGVGVQRASLSQRKGWGANGNVHTLRHEDDQEDLFRGGNSYWNGNSTEFGGEDENKRD